MNRLLLVLLAALPLAACAPTSGAMVPATGPLLYAAEHGDVFASVMNIITTAEGLQDSNGWIITESDSQGGFVRVDTTVLRPWRFWAPQRVESLSVSVLAAAPGRTQVVIQRTAGARELEVRLHNMLGEAHQRL
jgi:hypothetical protein